MSQPVNQSINQSINHMCDADFACGITSLNSPTNLLVDEKLFNKSHNKSHTNPNKSPIGSRRLLDYGSKQYAVESHSIENQSTENPWANYQMDSYLIDEYTPRPSQLPKLNEIIERMANIDQRLSIEQEKNNRLLQLLDSIDAKLNRLIDENSTKQTKYIRAEK